VTTGSAVHADPITVAATADLEILNVTGRGLTLELDGRPAYEPRITAAATFTAGGSCTSTASTPPCTPAPRNAVPDAGADAAALQSVLSALYAAAPVVRLDTIAAQPSPAGPPPGHINLYTLTLLGAEDWFVFRVDRTAATRTQTEAILRGVTPAHVLAYLTDAGALDAQLSRATRIVRGSIFSAEGEVVSHAPETDDDSLDGNNAAPAVRERRRWFWDRD
jgi:hypothetical protein